MMCLLYMLKTQLERGFFMDVGRGQDFFIGEGYFIKNFIPKKQEESNKRLKKYNLK